jgi:hypothetical protein
LIFLCKKTFTKQTITSIEATHEQAVRGTPERTERNQHRISIETIYCTPKLICAKNLDQMKVNQYFKFGPLPHKSTEKRRKKKKFPES